MESLLFLLLLGWIFNKISKAPKKKKSPAVSQPVKVVMSEKQKEKIQQARQAMQQMSMPVEETSFSQPGEGECDPEHMHSAEGEYRGSMDAAATEGVDFCDPSLEHVRTKTADPESVYANEIGNGPALDLSPRGIYQGIVMSEILTRPAYRRYR